MIKFGTDGWRGVIADDFTFANVRLVATAIASYVHELQEHEKGIVIGYDARFLSRQFAETCASVLAAKGIKVWLSDHFLPTPALTWQVVHRKASGGIMITASHNPPEYNGLKYKAPYGGSASPEIIQEIEKHVHILENKGILNQTEKTCPYELFAAKETYIADVKAMLESQVISSCKDKIVFDVMHGAAAGYPTSLAAEYGLNLIEIRNEYNPSFGGVNPEPVAKNLDALRKAIKDHQAAFGLVTDGDGDRIGAMDASGRFINAHEIIALLTKFLAEKRGWTGGVVQSLSLSGFVKKVAEQYGRKLYETPVGFKYITGVMLSEDVLVGGEEGGGIGLKNYIPERDGILIGFLLIEMAAAYGKPIGHILDEMMLEHGRFYYGRRDLHLTDGHKKRLMEALEKRTPAAIGQEEVMECRCGDGCKLVLTNGWVVFRASGTEPLVRIYSEMNSQTGLNEVLGEAVNYAEHI